MSVEKSLIDDFIVESREHLQKIQGDLIALENNPQDPDQRLIDKVFRSIHSIKGGAGFVNLQKIAEVSHIMETILQKIRQGEIHPNSNNIDALLNGSDLLKIMLDNGVMSNTIDISETCDLLSSIINNSSLTQPKYEISLDQEIHVDLTQEMPLDLKKEIPVEMTKEMQELDLSALNIDIKKLTNINDLFLLEFNLTDFSAIQKIYPLSIVKDILSMGEIIDSFIEKNATSLSENLNKLPLIYKVLYCTQMDEDSIPSIFMIPEDSVTRIIIQKDDKGAIFYKNQKTISKKNITLAENKTISTNKPDLNNIYDNKKIYNKTPENNQLLNISNVIQDQTETIRININLLDKLMNYAGELVLVRNRLLLESDSRSNKLYHISQDLDMLTSELQETVMMTRMQPIGNVFARLPRLVRDLSKKLNKYIDIQISGNEVELDKNILESLTDPLIHIVRNCCDHGIEIPDERLKIGKPSTGTIEIKAYHKGGLINIEIHDDGRGINIQAVKEKAIANKIISNSESERLSVKNILSLIMTPGFSTAEKMSDVSGRGVGMDVVKTALEQVGGSIEIDSEPGKGVFIHICLPLTLAIIPSLIIQMGNERYAIPQVNLDEIVRLYDEDVYLKIERSGNQEVFRLRDKLLPMVRLNEILKNPNKITDDKKVLITDNYQSIASQKISKNKTHAASLIFAVVKVGSRKFGLTIDHMKGTEEIVVNALPDTIKSLSIYSGTTIMGDGEVSLVLDIDGISKHWGVEFNYHYEKIIGDRYGLTSNDIQKVLLFEYGQKECFAVPLIMVKRIEHFKLKMIEQMGNKIKKEFINIHGETIFIVRLEEYIDISRIREKDLMFLLLPKNLKISFALLFSNLKGIVDMPQNLNTNYKIDGLLGTSIINERLTFFLDIDEIFKKAEAKLFSYVLKKEPDINKEKNILVAEDTDFFSQLIKKYLESEGYNVDIAENGLEALKLLNQKPFDLLVSDIEMPEMGGWELIKRVRNDNKLKKIPAIAVTSLDSKEAYNQSMECGFNRHEIKLNRETLISCISKILT